LKRRVSYPRTNLIFADDGLRVKRLPAAYSIFILLGPLLIIAALMAGPFGCGSGSSPVATPIAGTVEIGFVDSPSSGFQAISFNIVSVRLNPSTNPNVSDSDANWKVITAPHGSNVSTGGTLNVNLLDLQNDAAVFNIGKVEAQDYRQIEVVVDATFPGTVIPSCSASSSPAFEGCVNYPLIFTSTTNLRTTGIVNVTPTGLATLIIDINPGALTPPSSPGGNFTATPLISQVTPGNFVSIVTGTVAGAPKTGASVTAELTGTNLVVATTPVTNGSYSIALPAAATLGTTYDLFVEGTTTGGLLTGSVSFDAASGVTVMRAAGPLTQNFSVTANPSTSTITGSIVSSGTGTTGAIAGATVNLLRATGSTDCQISLGAGCVVVATTTSDSAGIYALTSVPIGNYFVEAQATGANTVIQPLTLTTSASLCTGSPNASNCSFTLPTAVIGGTVNVIPAASVSNSTSVIILAEQHGTDDLVGATEVTARSLSTPFTIQVPTKIGTVAPPDLTFDLIASAQDTYLGIGNAFTGHNQAVLADIAGGATDLEMTVECMGHGTIAGTVPFPDSGTHVRLFQDSVQLQDSTVGQTTSTFPNQYSFCAPPGNEYFVQKFEQTSPTSSPTAVGTPQGPLTVATPEPAASTSPSPGATPSPCPVCQNSAGQCPGNCSATTASPL
jgi:hypothetical protein